MVTAFFFAVGALHAQVNPPAKDTVKEKNDQMYKKIQDYSKKKKVTKTLHKFIFKPVKQQRASQSRRRVRERTPEMQVSFEKYEGKIVRRIIIQTLDPFGYSINDTTHAPDNSIERIGNRVHIKTKEYAIRNLLLFKKNEPLDSLLINDSERLLRSQRYIRRVIIKPQPIATTTDSVDVFIRVLDSWSLIPNGSVSTSSGSAELTERNFLGLGHQLENDFDRNFSSGQTAYLARYTIPNIKNTYINASGAYQIWKSDYWLKSVGLERTFFSAFTKWAGGAYYESRFEKDTLPNAQQQWNWQNYKTRSQDYWAGFATPLTKGITEEDRTTRFVTTARFYRRKYREKPTIEYDSVGYYNSERLYLASVGITSRKYVQDKFLFNYDIVEDIPIGKVYSATFGVQDKSAQQRFYVGARYAFGNYYRWGYFSTNVEVGSFFYHNLTQQTTMRIDALYFTNIRNLGAWRLRHFVRPVIVLGENRMGIYTDQLNINGENGIPGFNSRTLKGTKKALLTLQTQAFSPWNVGGFRINPFVNVTLGLISNTGNKLYDGPLYSKFGMGLLLYNDYLIFNSFQLSLAYYPNIPDSGYNIFKTNAIENNDIALPDFQIAKPTVVPYE
ncbi:hypothetical protein ACLI1A_07950 [Flavobacterium sp. RHBU_3]|uniref:hypothetical protein n=1 Tax=Flavobacterium sp. RHBU_3 TaxID=3391184 RepID=UPI0039848883